MKRSTALRAMGDYIAEHGFSAREHGRGKAGCFVNARHMATSLEWCPDELYEVVGATSLGVRDLLAAGWNARATKDAAAACYIAADLAEPAP